MKIINSKLTTEELAKVYRVSPPIGNIRDLNIYNSGAYFNIQKFYNKGELVGYAVIFLGYNCLTSNDASLEDIVYWKGNLDELKVFLDQVKNAQDYSIPVENFYYDSDLIDISLIPLLNDLGFKEKNLVRWME